MGLVYNAFKRSRAQLYVPRALKERSQAPQAVYVDRPVRSIRRLFARLPSPAIKREAKRMKYQGHRDRPWLEAQYYHFERVVKYANFNVT